MSQNNTLSKLGSDVFVLIRNGIYSLYEIEGQATEKFLLITNERRNIILSQDGEVIREVESLSGLRLKKATVEKAQASQYSVKLNYA